MSRATITAYLATRWAGALRLLAGSPVRVVNGPAIQMRAFLLSEAWERSALRKFRDAEAEADPMGKRLIEHGAICLYNCAIQLKAIVSEKAES